MAADGQIRERVYRAIKQKLVEGEFALDQHVDLGSLCRALKASPTPVKEALVRLNGERLVVAKGKGFHVARWTAAQLRELYAWRQSLVLLALDGAVAMTIPPRNQSSIYALQVRHLLGVAEEKAGDELRYAAANADDRLSYARLVEPELWPDVSEELEDLRAALMSAASGTRTQGVRLYFARRVEGAQSIRDRAILRSNPNGS
jgi:DNA-binding GntR family transcriptional regulator